MELREKKEAHCRTRACKTREVGDAYTYLAVKRDSQFLTCFVVGKWNDDTCDKFYAKLASRLRFPTRKRRVTILTDGNKQNITAIKRHFPVGSVNYGMKKTLRKRQRIVGVVHRVMLGKLCRDTIRINTVDGFCTKLRERISCFVRKAHTYAKERESLEHRLEIFSVQHNFIEKKHGRTPAMQEGLHCRPLTWSKVLHTKLSTLN